MLRNSFFCISLKLCTKYFELVGDEYSYGYKDELTYYANQIKFYVDQAEKGNVEYAFGNIKLSKI